MIVMYVLLYNMITYVLINYTPTMHMGLICWVKCSSEILLPVWSVWELGILNVEWASAKKYYSIPFDLLKDIAIVRLQRKYSYIIGLGTTPFVVFFNILKIILMFTWGMHCLSISLK